MANLDALPMRSADSAGCLAYLQQDVQRVLFQATRLAQTVLLPFSLCHELVSGKLAVHLETHEIASGLSYDDRTNIDKELASSPKLASTTRHKLYSSIGYFRREV